MKKVSISYAFSAAPPRRPGVVCFPTQGKTLWKATLWFTWLNMKHQPMLSFALERNSGVNLRTEDVFLLAFPPVAETEKYKELVQPEEEQGNVLAMEETCALVPQNSEVILRCTVSHAYNYPFKNVRIFNCNLEEALCAEPEE